MGELNYSSVGKSKLMVEIKQFNSGK